jgi:ubiquinone/menaquinone biosynthesis C-methylase UbiE
MSNLSASLSTPARNKHSHKSWRSASVEEGYARWAATYDQTPNPLLAVEERYLAPLLPEMRGLRVLDLACGTARWLRTLAPKGIGLGVGIDLSAEMLRVAQPNLGQSSHLVRANCLNLPLEDAAFDLVICSFALEHVRQLDQFSNEVSRILRKAGHVFLTQLHPAAHRSGWRNGFRDSRGRTQIDSAPHPTENVILSFQQFHFEAKRVLECFIGEPEIPIFVSARKEQLFRDACQLPAILMLHLAR